MGGRAMGPMGMSMRGAGGQVLPSKLPPSLQAKMDAVSTYHYYGSPRGGRMRMYSGREKEASEARNRRREGMPEQVRIAGERG